jgi:hypothetical protein
MAGALIQHSFTVDLWGTPVLLQGWEVMFYLFGICGLLWFPFYVWRVHEHPSDDPSISMQELVTIKSGEALHTLNTLNITIDTLPTRQCRALCYGVMCPYRIYPQEILTTKASITSTTITRTRKKCMSK